MLAAIDSARLGEKRSDGAQQGRGVHTSVRGEPQERRAYLGNSAGYKNRYYSVSTHLGWMNLLSVGSWLPNVLDESIGTEHTTYFMSIHLAPLNISWQLSKRFALFHDFNKKIRREIARAFPEGMKQPFPDNRMQAWMWGMSDKVRDVRRDGLNKWFQELLLNRRFMLNCDAVKLIHEFIELNRYVEKLRDTKAALKKETGAPSTILTQSVSDRFMKRMQSSSGHQAK